MVCQLQRGPVCTCVFFFYLNNGSRVGVKIRYLGNIGYSCRLMLFFPDYLMDTSSLRRTVSNEYAPTPPPPPPVFNIKPSSPYTWVKPTSSNATRISPRKSDVERERERQRDYKIMTSMVGNFVLEREKKFL